VSTEQAASHPAASDRRSAPATRIHRSPIALLTVTHAVNDLYQGAIPVLIPFLALERHYGYAALTGITLAATFLSSVVQPGFGLLTDRRHFSWLIPAGMLVAGLGVGLSGLGHSYTLTWLAIALSGIGVAAYHPEAARAARVVARSSTHAMSWFSVGGNIGVALAPLLMTPVLLATGLRGTPLLAAPALLMAGALVAASSRARRTNARNAAGRPGGRKAGAGGEEGGPDEDRRAFGALTAVVVTRSVLYFSMISFLALLFIREGRQSETVGSWAVTVFSAAGAVGTVAGGWLADRWGRLETIRLGYALCVPCAFALVTVPDTAARFVLTAVLGVALFLPFTVQVTLGQDYLPQHIGTASGMTLGLANSVGGLTAPLLGLLADRVGLVRTLEIAAVFPLLALLCTARLREPRAAG
jgi:FSR family fosmidomycin resistance protein-like MFS transporter